MSLKTLNIKVGLQKQAFLNGMSTALDIYGIRGQKAHEQIHRDWESLMSEPVIGAQEAIMESIALVNCEYQTLLSKRNK